MEPSEWRTMLGRLNLSTVDLREGRYDAVVHLVTAALGAEPFYTTENNTARSETVEQARDQDRRTQRVWAGHPHMSIVDNRAGTGFEQKMRKVIKIVARVVGLPSTSKHFSKFICAVMPTAADLPPDAVVSDHRPAPCLAPILLSDQTVVCSQ